MSHKGIGQLDFCTFDNLNKYGNEENNSENNVLVIILCQYSENENDIANYNLAWFSHSKIREKWLRD